MITEEEIKEYGWVVSYRSVETPITRYTKDVYIMVYDRGDGRTIINKEPDTYPILECKIQDKRDLQIQMDWLEIK